ncbi:MAG: HlyC/CorC family transporter [Candidatus Riflebacteria bacterium]|nr:HlyC/CorC family transporter [Candidatus Riflebacteria bacterium]
MTGIVFYLCLTMVFLALNAVFNGAETGLVSLDTDYLRYKSRGLPDTSREKRLLKLAQSPDHYLGLTLIGINSCLVIATSLATALMESLAPSLLEAGTVLLSIFIFLFCEFLPKMAFNSRPLVYCLKYLKLLLVAEVLFKLPINAVSSLTRFTMRLFRVPAKTETGLSREELLILLSHGASTGTIAHHSNRMAQGIIGLRNTIAREVMIPRINMLALDINTPPELAQVTVIRSGFSRVPVFREHVDKIIGVLYFKDLFLKDGGVRHLEEIISKPLFVPETKLASELFKEMRRCNSQMAVLLDEFASVSGIVTFEDLVEQVVGEIHDEFDKPRTELKYNDDGSINVRGDMHIDRLNDEAGLELSPVCGETTVNGLILAFLGKIPEAGETFIIDGVKMRIIESSQRKVEWLRISRVENS